MNQSTKIKLIGCDTIVNSPSFLFIINSTQIFISFGGIYICMGEIFQLDMIIGLLKFVTE